MSEVVTFRAEAELVEEIDRHAEERGCSRSRAVRSAVKRGLGEGA